MDQGLRQLAERAAGPWLEYREAEVRADRAAGRKAMTTNAALLQRRHADFQEGLIGRAKAAVLALRTEVATYAADLRRQLEDLGRERDEHIGQKLIETRENRQTALQHLERNRWGRSRPAMRPRRDRWRMPSGACAPSAPM